MKKIVLPFLLLMTFVSGVYAVEVQDTITMREVVIDNLRNAAEVVNLPQSVNVLRRDALTEAYRPSTLPTLSELVPGLFIPNRGMMGYGVNSGGAGAVLVRGLSSGVGQMLVCIDGEPQYSGIYGHSVADFYQSHALDRVEVLRGPASARYGSNAMGGVLNMVTRVVSPNRVATNVTVGAGSYGTVQTEATNQVQKGRFSSLVTAQFNRSDNHRDNMEFQQAGGMAKLGYRFSRHWNASTMADVNYFYTELPGAVTKPMFDNEQWIVRGSANLTLRNNYTRPFRISTQGGVTIYTNFGKHKIDDGTADPEKPSTNYFQSRDNVAGVSAWQRVDFFKGNRTTFGIDYQHIYGWAYYTSKETGEELPPSMASGKSHRNEVAGYVDFYQEVTNWLTLDATLRVDHHSVAGTEIVPQGALLFKPMRDGELKVAVAKGFRNPTMRELYLYRVANDALDPERLMNYELSWKHWVMAGRLSYGVNVFYMKGKDIIQTAMLNGAMLNRNVGEVENCGLELSLDYHIGNRWELITNHSYLHMENPVLSAPTYKGYLGTRFHEGRWSAQAGLQYVAGLYTAVGANEEKENFCLFSASVSHRVWKGLKLWLRGETLIGERSYETILGYPMPQASVMAGISWDF
ncbi:MAG: TonB-dependent receptor [Bacteroidaceae bacterium]|nr:TonB-dependent receptor [Bacteroidaceae bacterium]